MPEAKIILNVRKPVREVSIIDIEGEVTAFGEPVMMDAYSQAAGEGVKSIILNFSRLEYMNSGGIGLIVTLLIRAQRQGQRLSAYGLNDHYEQIFELTRLNEAITISPDEAGALSAAGAGVAGGR